MTRTTVRYGTRRGQVGDLWAPATPPAAGAPVVVLVHGGFWRAQYTKLLMRRLARSVVAHGWAAWNIEYRRTGRLGGGGGWPTTFADVAAAVDALEHQHAVDLDRVVTCGHSAGGLLALWLAARPRLADRCPGSPVKVPVRGVVSLAGVPDLRRAFELGGGAVGTLLGGSPEAVPDRYESASPLASLPLGVPQVLIHGTEDTVVSPAMSESYVRQAVELGDDAVFAPIAGAGHRDLLSPTGAGWSVAVEHLERMLAT